MDIVRQSFFIPAPTLTEKNCPDQYGKVHIVTGGYVGCGYELTKILYQHNATIYVAGRSPQKASTAIQSIKDAHPSSKGRLEFLKLDLADLTTIKASADDFLSKEDRLDVLTNNAGVMIPPLGSKTKQGYDLQLGTNCLGPFLFTQCLVPVLQRTAKKSPPGQVRVTWAASLVVEAAPAVGVVMADDGTPTLFGKGKQSSYNMSKAGNVFYAVEFARRYGGDGILSVAWNPGNLRTELQRHINPVFSAIVRTLLTYPAIYGGYTELFAAVSPDLTLEQNGSFIHPWGRVGGLRRIHDAVKSKSEGGQGYPELFWYWSEKETRQYM